MPDKILVWKPEVLTHLDLCASSYPHKEPAITYTRTDLYTSPNVNQTGVDDWIKAQPAEDYEGLKRQFSALKTLLNSQGQRLSYYIKKDYTTSEQRIAILQASLESEKAMNAQLTEELASITALNQQPVSDVLKIFDAGAVCENEYFWVNKSDIQTIRTALANSTKND
jgi:hypothetical protein